MKMPHPESILDHFIIFLVYAEMMPLQTADQETAEQLIVQFDLYDIVRHKRTHTHTHTYNIFPLKMSMVIYFSVPVEEECDF